MKSAILDMGFTIYPRWERAPSTILALLTRLVTGVPGAGDQTTSYTA